MEVDTSFTTASKPLIIVQHDWDKVASSQDDETFFVGVRTPNQSKTQFVDVKLDISGTFSNKTVECEMLAKRALRVSVKNAGVSKTFVPPSVEYDALHKTAISCIAISRSNNLAVTAEDDTLRVWNANTGSLVRDMKGHIMSVTCARFFPSGSICLSGGIDMTVRIMCVESGECARTMKGHRAPITDLAFIGRGEQVLSSSKDGTVRSWNCGEGECTVSSEPNDGGALTSICLGASHDLLATCSDQGQVTILGVPDLSQQKTVNVGAACSSICAADDYLHVATGESIATIDVRNHSSILRRHNVNRGTIHRIESAADGGVFVALADGGMCHYNMQDGDVDCDLELTGADCDPIYDFALDAERRRLYTASRDHVIRKYTLDGQF